MKKLPRLTRRSEIEIRGVYGQPVFDIYQQARAILERAAPDRRLSTFFAEPQLNPARGEIAWYSTATGDVKSLAQLDEASRAALLDSVDSIRKQIRAAGERFAAEGGGASGTRAEIFKAMLSATNLEQCLFLVGTQPVLCEWGCKPLRPGAEDVDLWSYGGSLRSPGTGDSVAALPNPSVPSPGPTVLEVRAPAESGPKIQASGVPPVAPIASPSVPLEADADQRPLQPHSRQLPRNDNLGQHRVDAPTHRQVAPDSMPAVASTTRDANWVPTSQKTFGVWELLKRLIVALLLLLLVVMLLRGCDDGVHGSSARSEEMQLRQDIAALRTEASKVLAACPAK